MEFNLALRLIKLPGGITLECKPLSTLAYQKYLSAMSGHKDPEPIKILTDPDILKAVQEILGEHVTKIEGLTVKDGSGERLGTLADLMTNAQGYPLLIRATQELFQSSILTETDMGNSPALPPTS